MTIEMFEEISLYVGVGGLILYMIYIMYKLGQESNAGKTGMIWIFIGLGVGIFGFVIKLIIQAMMDV